MAERKSQFLYDDLIACGAPDEMISPGLLTGIEQAHNLAGRGVEHGDAVALVIIAHRARRPQVFSDGQTSQRFRRNVVDLHSSARDAGGGQTVATAVACLGEDRLSQCLGDMATAHVGRTPIRRGHVL